jgi:hypothetical protein
LCFYFRKRKKKKYQIGEVEGECAAPLLPLQNDGEKTGGNVEEQGAPVAHTTAEFPFLFIFVMIDLALIECLIDCSRVKAEEAEKEVAVGGEEQRGLEGLARQLGHVVLGPFASHQGGNLFFFIKEKINKYAHAMRALICVCV